MKKTLFEEECEGIQFLSRRFISGLSCNDQVFQKCRFYRRTCELSFIISLSICIVLFLGWKRFVTKQQLVQQKELVFLVEEIPHTEQSRPKPAPPRPSVPIASEDEEIPEETTIAFTDFDFEDDPPPPPPLDDGSLITFVPFDEPPCPVGGLQAISRHLEYPEAGRLAGVEGTVVLQIQVDEKGTIRNIRVLQTIGSGDFAEAACKAVRAVKWKPAKQREIPVMVWCSIPVEFSLHN